MCLGGHVFGNSHSNVVSRDRPRPKCTKKIQKTKKIFWEKTNKPRLLLFGDSHARGCESRLSDMGGGGSYRVQATVMPGATMATVLEDLKDELTNKPIGKEDVCVIVGGTNDVSLPRSMETVEMKLNDIVHRVVDPKNLLFVETPYRMDLKSENNAIKKQNQTISDFCKKNNFAYLNLNSMLDEKCYTRQGLHLNYIGKDVLCNLILTYMAAQKNLQPSKNLNDFLNPVKT